MITNSSINTVVQEDIRNIVEIVGDSFDQLDGKRIFITGGTGFVGSYLLETIAYLNDKMLVTPCRIFTTTRNPERFSERFPHLACRKDIVLLQGDVRTFSAPVDPCDLIIHAASPADSQVLALNPLETMDVIVEGTRRVLNLAAEKGVERLLFLSSGAVYGPQPHDLQAIPEDYHGGPDIRNGRASYGEAKRYAEVMCQVFQEDKGIPVSIARLFSFVGPYQDMNSSFAVVDFIRHGLRGETIRIKGDGKATRTFCYSADLTVALWKILLCAKPGEVYNVGSDCDAVSIEELANKVAEKVNPKVRVLIEGHGKSDSLRPRYIPDITKLKNHLRYSLNYDLDTSLTRTINYLLKESRKMNLGLGER